MKFKNEIHEMLNLAEYYKDINKNTESFIGFNATHVLAAEFHEILNRVYKQGKKEGKKR